MTIIQAIQQLRDDLKEWTSNQLKTKVSKNVGAEKKDTFLMTDDEGVIIFQNFSFIDIKLQNAINDFLNSSSTWLECMSVNEEDGSVTYL